MTGCSVHRTAIKGTVDVIEDNWCAIEVDSENNELEDGYDKDDKKWYDDDSS